MTLGLQKGEECGGTEVTSHLDDACARRLARTTCVVDTDRETRTILELPSLATIEGNYICVLLQWFSRVFWVNNQGKLEIKSLYLNCKEANYTKNLNK